MDKVLKGHEKINELVTKYHEVKASIVEAIAEVKGKQELLVNCLLYTSPSPRDS